MDLFSLHNKVYFLLGDFLKHHPKLKPGYGSEEICTVGICSK
jgi:hypothetical protein